MNGLTAPQIALGRVGHMLLSELQLPRREIHTDDGEPLRKPSGHRHSRAGRNDRPDFSPVDELADIDKRR